MTYFTNINTLEELKKAYRRLAMLHHPDRGGSTQVKQQINNEYDNLFNHLKSQHNEEAATNSSKRPIHETPEQFRDILNQIINLPGIVIELCGSWIWVSGNTKEYRDIFKTLGFMWSPKKSMWYWRNKEDASPSRGAKSMDYIRSKYGSERVSSDGDYLTA